MDITFCSKEEIREFWDALEREGKLFGVPVEAALTATIAVCARLGDRVIGIAGLRPRFRVPLLFIVVEDAFHGQGVGRSLMQSLLKDAVRRYSYIVLTVSKQNERAVSWYLKLGFQRVFSDETTDYMILYLPKSNPVTRLLVSLAVKMWGAMGVIRNRWKRSRPL